MATKQKEAMKQLTVPAHTHRKVKVEAARFGLSMSAYLDAVVAFAKREEFEPKKK